MLRGWAAPDRRGLNEITSSGAVGSHCCLGMLNCDLMVSFICEYHRRSAVFSNLIGTVFAGVFRGGRRADQILMLNYLEIKLAECQWKSVARFVFPEHRKLMDGKGAKFCCDTRTS